MLCLQAPKDFVMSTPPRAVEAALYRQDGCCAVPAARHEAKDHGGQGLSLPTLVTSGAFLASRSQL